MANTVSVIRNLAGKEDLLLGFGVVDQTREGVVVPITKFNASNFPYDETQTLEQAIQNEKAIAFAIFSISVDGDLIAVYGDPTLGVFSINDEGQFVIEYTDPPVPEVTP